MKGVLIFCLILISSMPTLSQDGLCLGLDFGKSISLNSLIYSNENLQNRTHFVKYMPKAYDKSYILRFPNIWNLGFVADYRWKSKAFLRVRMQHTKNWVMFLSTEPTSFDLIFPSPKQNKYFQEINYFGLSYNRQRTKINRFFSIGIGSAISVYKVDLKKKESFNLNSESKFTSYYILANDSIVNNTETYIEGANISGKHLAQLGVTFNIEYSLQFKNAGRMSIYANACLSVTNPDWWFNIYHSVFIYDRITGLQSQHYNTTRYFRFTHNPLQLGIIYYFPSLKFNQNIERKKEL